MKLLRFAFLVFLILASSLLLSIPKAFGTSTKFWFNSQTFNLSTDVYWQMNTTLYDPAWGWEVDVGPNSRSGSITDWAYYGFKAYVLNANNTKTEIATTGVHLIGSIDNSSTDQTVGLSATWTPSATVIVSTDRLMLTFWARRTLAGSWQQIGGVNGYLATPSALGWTTIDATQWTVYAVFRRYWNALTSKVDMYVEWGNAVSPLDYRSYVDGVSGTVPATTTYTFNGSATETFTINTLKSAATSKQAGTSLSFILNNGRILSFPEKGSAVLAFIINSWKAISTGKTGNGMLAFLVNTLKSMEFSRYGNAPLIFNVQGTYVKTVLYNLVGNALLQFAVNMGKALDVNRHGTSTLAFTTALEKLVAFAVHGTSQLSFAVESLSGFVFGTILTLFGSAILSFIENAGKALRFNRQGNSILTFISTTASNVIQYITTQGRNPLVEPIVVPGTNIILLPTEGQLWFLSFRLWLVGFVLLGSAGLIVFGEDKEKKRRMKALRKKMAEKGPYD